MVNPALRTLGRDPDNDVFVLRMSDLDRARDWRVSALVVVDATRDGAPSLPVLAQIVMLRRRLRAGGGNLVVAASPDVAGVLRGSGLHWAVPCCTDLTGAIAAVRQHQTRPGGRSVGQPARGSTRPDS